MVEKALANAKDYPPADDKSRFHESLQDLDDETLPVINHSSAAAVIGRVAMKYGAEFVIICDGMGALKKALHHKSPTVVVNAARSAASVAIAGGVNELIEEGIDNLLLDVIYKNDTTFYVRDMCVRAYGWICIMNIKSSENLDLKENIEQEY